MTRRPAMQDLSGHLAAAARAIAGPLAGSGRRAWIVGGAPRDLALGGQPSEIDMASAATPAEVEALFEHTVPVGRPFGTVIVRAGEVDVQHTTFRSESTYSDARRPDEVAFGATVEEDATRRDFTCNALYLDPLEDAFLDPTGGLADLSARCLRCVGDPEARFREDGLRLLRLARFAAALDLEPEPGTLAAARRSGDSLRGVSPERVLAEMVGILGRRGAVRALSLLSDLDLLERALPHLADLAAGEGGRKPWWEARRRVFEALPSAPGIALGLAALLGPAQAGKESQARSGITVVGSLRPSRALRQRVEAIWAIAQDARAAISGPRSIRIRWMRSPAFEEGIALARARARASGAEERDLEDAQREREQMGEEGLWPRAWISAEDLKRLDVPNGPRWGEMLREAEELQLDGRLASREEALAWLAQRAHASSQEGGKRPRSA
jgi:poly(A) polymerase